MYVLLRNNVINAYVTGLAKTDLIVTFSISDLKY